MDTEELRVLIGIVCIVFGTVLLAVGAYGAYLYEKSRKAERNK